MAFAWWTVWTTSSRSPFHAGARGWLEQQLGGDTRVGLPWVSLLGFMRVVANPRVFPQCATVREAWNQVARWRTSPVVWSPESTEHHASILARLFQAPGLRAADVPDVELAALAIEYGLTLCSTDTGYARFADLRWKDPLRGMPGVRERRGRYRAQSGR